ncbi:MAG: sulfotransferase domain-containing protein [Cyclobacteriaceae bacterium]
MDASLYGKQLTEYLKLFDLSQILVVKLEDLENEPPRILNQIFNFIGVDSSKYEFKEVRSHKTSDKRRLTTIGSLISRIPLGRRVCNVFKSICWEEFNVSKLSDENKLLLQNYFRNDQRLLNEITGQSFYSY